MLVGVPAGIPAITGSAIEWCEAHKAWHCSLSSNLQVLLADADAGRRACLERRLTEVGTVILRASAGASLLEAVVSQAADLLAIGMAQPDPATLEGLPRIAATNSVPTALFAARHDRASFTR